MAEVTTAVAAKGAFCCNVLNGDLLDVEAHMRTELMTAPMMRIARCVLFDLGMTDTEIVQYFMRFNYLPVETTCSDDVGGVRRRVI